MKTTNFHTNNRKKKSEWEELMSSLNIHSSLRLTLMNLVAQRFYKDFQQSGIVYVDDGDIKYHPLTDEWDSPEWDGE
jgi:hypothetical protein